MRCELGRGGHRRPADGNRRPADGNRRVADGRDGEYLDLAAAVGASHARVCFEEGCDRCRAPVRHVVVEQLPFEGRGIQRNWYFIAERPAPAPHLAHPEGCAALRIVLVTVPRVSRSCEHFPDGFDLYLLRSSPDWRESVSHRSLIVSPNPHGGGRPFHQKSTCHMEMTLGPYVVQI